MTTAGSPAFLDNLRFFLYNENQDDGPCSGGLNKERQGVSRGMTKEELYQIFRKIPVLSTPRLTLRALQVSDAFDLFDYARRSDVTKYLLWFPHRSVEYTKEYLRYIGQRYAVGSFYDWALINRDDGKMIGTCGFTSIDLANRSAEIGYVLNPDYRGHGLAAEAGAEVLRFGFEVLGLNRIEARIMQGNDASLRVAEKLGMHFEGWKRDGIYIKGSFRTIGICSILKKEFR